MFKILTRIIGLVIFLMITALQVTAGEINGIRFWQDPEKTRLVFDLSDSLPYKVFTLENPHRLVIDIERAALKVDVSKLEVPSQLVNQIRSSEQDKMVRLVLDLKNGVTTTDFTLKPYQSYGHRLVIDLLAENFHKQAVKTAATAIKEKNRDIVIAIDAGHGGEDPGALGTQKSHEKAITLEVARRLAKLIDAEPGMKAVLTRDGDYFVSLRKRTDIARDNKADLFISLHADAFTDSRVKGASVWVLSPKGANSELGRWLEQREQSSDLAGGVDISNRDPLVAQVLLDLSMHYSVGASINAASDVYDAMKSTLPKMHKKSVQKAAFVVLKMPDIPAMLVEMAFISNPDEEKLLKTASQQIKISQAVFAGVKKYFRNSPPDGSYFASLAKTRSYEVKSGDTLSQIAQTFGVSTNELMNFNKLKSSQLRIGQTLAIPGA